MAQNRVHVSMSLLLLLCFSLALVMTAEPIFDFVIFSQQTSAGYCLTTFKDRCVKNNMRDFWTIHGLWPSSATSSPDSCNVTGSFDVNALAPLRPRLDQVWPTYKTNDPVGFWSYEWKKHGSCAYEVPQLAGVFNFFSETLRLYDKYNLTEFLANDNILPSKKIAYPVEDVLYALKNDLRGKTNIVCDRTQGFEYPILTEIRLCLSKFTLTPIDCPYKKERCGKDKVFYLPLHGDGAGASGETRSNVLLLVFTFLSLFVIKYFR